MPTGVRVPLNTCSQDRLSHYTFPSNCQPHRPTAYYRAKTVKFPTSSYPFREWTLCNFAFIFLSPFDTLRFPIQNLTFYHWLSPRNLPLTAALKKLSDTSHFLLPKWTIITPWNSSIGQKRFSPIFLFTKCQGRFYFWDCFVSKPMNSWMSLAAQ